MIEFIDVVILILFVRYYTLGFRVVALENKKSSKMNSCFLMVGKTGFEPATTRSQTECSTKLSHFPLIMVHPRGFEPLTSWSVARRSIQLSYGCNVLAVINISLFLNNFNIFLKFYCIC